MATQVQFRGGTTSEHSTFTGVAREVTVDTTKKTVVVHDGSTAGGIPLAKESAVTSAAAITGGSINGTTVGASTASTGAFTTLSASSTVSGAGFSTYLASPPAIGGTTASTGRFTTVTATGLTSGRVTYAGASGLLSDSANLTWDNTNARLGIGTSSPATKLNIENAGECQLQMAYSSTIFGRVGRLSSGNYEFSSYENGGSLLFGTTTSNGSTTERMRITSAGNVGIGTSSPNAKLQITSSAFPVLKVADAIGGGALALGDEGTNNNYVGIWRGAANSTSGGGFLNVQGNGIAFMSSDNVFGSASERMRIDSSGTLLLGTTSAAANQQGIVVTTPNTTNKLVGTFINASSAGPYGVAITYNALTPNSTGNEFLITEDSTARRFYVVSNGGIYNYQANDGNLSDRREKTNFTPATSYLDKICAIPVQTFNYIDQNLEEDDGLTLGVVAQDVQAVAPELVKESDWAKQGEEPKMRLSIYQTDLQYALMKCIQEQQVLIESLTTRLTALENK